MLRLVRVELNRLRWRRAVQLLVPLTLLVPLAVLAIWTLSTDSPKVDVLQQAKARATVEAQQPIYRHELRRCLDKPHPNMSDADRRAWCDQMTQPQPDWFMSYNVQSSHDALVDFGPAVAMIVAGALALAAMTYAGADWSSGSMSNQLLFNPRREQLFVGKAVAIGVLAAVVTLVVQVVWWGVFAAIAAGRDLGWQSAWTGDAVWLVAKSVGFSALIATGAYFLTMLLRHTVAALAVTLVVIVLASLFVDGLNGDRHVQQFSPALNTAGIFVPDITYTTYQWSTVQEERDYSEHRIGAADGFTYWGVLWALVGAGSLVAFRRRDVP